MPLNLKDMMEKAKQKGITSKNNTPPSPSLLKPWQQESVLFNNIDPPNNEPSSEKVVVQIDNTAIKKSKNNQNKQKNWRQTGDKVETKRKQSGDKTEDEVKTKWRQKNKSGDKVVSQPETLSETKWRQSGDKVETKHSFSTLVGLQKSLLIFIYNECHFARSKITNNLTLEYIYSSLNHPRSSVKTTLRRLEIKKLIQRVEYKNGRGGWSKYSLDDFLFQEILKHKTEDKLDTKCRQSVDKVVSQPETEPETSLSSSSSIYNNITTTTELPEEWLKIDLFSLEGVGFTQHHLIQLYKTTRCDPKSVQDSIDHFSFDLLENNKATEIKTNPLGYFMGILKRSGVYTAPENYEAPKDRAMRIYLEQQKAIQKKREKMENELLEIAFIEWTNGLTEADKTALLPEEVRRMNLSGAKESHLRKHFREILWGEEREKRLMKLNEIKEI